MRLLVVEDDPGIVENLSAFLRLEQYDVDTAGTEDTAVEKMLSAHFDLLLVDITLSRCPHPAYHRAAGPPDAKRSGTP